MASVLETELKQFLDRGLLNLVLCFVDRQRMQCHPEETAVTEIQEAVDPLYNFFTQSFRGLGKHETNLSDVKYFMHPIHLLPT